MRNTKTVTEYVDNRFGFPITIYNVKMVEVRGEWILKINYDSLSDMVLRLLSTKSSYLTGNEIKFIRNRFEMTLEEFGKRFYVSHQAVMKWEESKDKPTKMSWATEKDIRLFIHKKLFDKGLSDIYSMLERKPNIDTSKHIEIDVKSLEFAIV